LIVAVVLDRGPLSAWFVCTYELAGLDTLGLTPGARRLMPLSEHS